MNLQQRRGMVIESMKEQGVDLLLGFHDNGHFIEKPNPVMLLAAFKSLGNAMTALHADGEVKLMVEPAWDAERAQEKVLERIQEKDRAAKAHAAAAAKGRIRRLGGRAARRRCAAGRLCRAGSSRGGAGSLTGRSGP